MTTVESLRAYTCKDLAAMARRYGVNGWHEMRKDQLVRALVRLARKHGGASHNGAAPDGGSSHNGAAPAERFDEVSDHSHAAPAPAGGNGSAGLEFHVPATPGIKQFHRVRQLSKNLAKGRAGDAKQPRAKDRLVVMVRDPYWLHACWELRRQSIERAAAALGQHWHTARPVLRLMEVNSDGTTNAIERVVRDVEIHGGVNHWYLHVENPPMTYRVAIGYRGEGDQFYCIARSNVVTTPSPDASDELDRNWDDVARNFDKIYAMSGGYDEDRSAGDLQELFEERLRRPMGSPRLTRFGAGAQGVVRDGRRSHFEVNAEMIVYGVANPDAHVTLRGEPVQLREDGSFTVRLSLPERRQVIPVVANSADGVEQRTIVLAVERNTKVMEAVIREPEEPQGG